MGQNINIHRGADSNPTNSVTWFNGIEEFWAEAKVVFRHMGTKALIKTGQREIWDEAHAATMAVPDENARKYAMMGFEAIQSIQLPEPMEIFRAELLQ